MRTFGLHFHLPVYIWRTQAQLKTDLRQKYGRPLRRSRDLSFLNLSQDPGGTAQQECLYEAQVSCLVTGLDDFAWVAYVFQDSYYQNPDDSASVESSQYHEYHDDPRMDPLCAGKYPSDRPIWLPREYFLRVYDVRVEQARKEWSNTVHTLLDRVQPYVSQLSSCSKAVRYKATRAK
jgi:hypothetical protein